MLVCVERSSVRVCAFVCVCVHLSVRAIGREIEEEREKYFLFPICKVVNHSKISFVPFHNVSSVAAFSVPSSLGTD